MKKNLVHKDLAVYAFQDDKALHEWLKVNHSQKESFWLRLYKKGSNIQTVSYSDAVDELLCWGWIDGLVNKFDEASYLIRISPRRPKSVWSKINVERVSRLIAGGRMQPQGLVHVDSAKADGRWDAAYGGQATIKVPDEFLQLLNTNRVADQFYQTLDKANKYAIAFRIQTAVGDHRKQVVMQNIIKRLEEKKPFH